MDDIEAVFNRKDMTFEEAVQYFKERVPVTASVFYGIAEKYRGLAFTVGGYTKAQILKRFYEEILAALEQGNPLSEFRRNMNEFLEAEGYEGLDPLQADLIFRTNIQTAYNVGHYEQMTDPGVMKLRPYWQYDAVNDAHTRRVTSRWTGGSSQQTARYGIHGSRRTGSDAAARSRRSQRDRSRPGGSRWNRQRRRASCPTPHFSTNPAKVRFEPDLKDYPAPLVKAYQNREKENPGK